MTYFLVAAAVVAAIAAVADWKTGEIPNWLTLGALLVAPVAYGAVAAVHHTPDVGMQVVWSLLGAIICAIVPGLLYRQDAIGGGDVKLLVALGAILQWRLGLEAEMYSFFAAGLIAPARLAYEGKLFRTIKNTSLLALNPLLPKKKRRTVEPTLLTWFRFGPAIFLGTVLVVYVHWRQ